MLEPIAESALDAQVTQALTEGIREHPTAAWPEPPLIGAPSMWSAQPPGAMATRLLSALAHELHTSEQWLNCGPITRLRTIRPLCYRGTTLCEGAVTRFDGKPGLVVFLVGDDDTCVLLNGRAAPIHSFNANKFLNLSEEENVLQYLGLFCSAIEADQGPFRLLWGADDIQLTGTIDQDELVRLSQYVRPPRIVERNDDGDWVVEAHTIYGSRVFHTRYKVRTETGMVEMLDDDQLPSDPLPAEIWSFYGNLRSERAAAIAGQAPLPSAEPEIPDQLIEHIFADSRAQDLLREFMRKNHLTGAPSDLALQTKRQIVENLVAQGVIKFGDEQGDG